MKGQLLISVFLGVISVGVVTSYGEFDLPYMRECVSELKLGALARIFAGQKLDSPSVYCSRACLWTKIGFMKNAKVDLTLFEKYLAQTRKPEESEVLLNRMKECQVESEISDDPCEVILHYARCIKSKETDHQ